MPEEYYFEGGRVYQSNPSESPLTGQRPLSGSSQGPSEEGVLLAQGLSAIVRDMGAAAQELRKASGEMGMVAQRNQTMYGVSSGTPGGAGQVQRQMTQDIVQTARQEAEALIQPTGKEGRQSVDPAEIAAITQQTGAPASPAMGPSSRDSYESARDYFGGKGQFNLSNLRQGLGARMQERMGNWQYGEQLAQDEGGAWRAVKEDGGLGELADEARVAAFMGREKIMGVGREFSRSLAEGQTLRSAGLGALPGAAAKGLGVGAAALFAGQQIGGFFEGQRATNAEWQRIQGGSNIDALGERFGQQMFGISQFGTMGGQEAERLYRGVSETGMQGDQRRTALDFATQSYRELGMTVDQSLRIVNIAARTGQENLSGLAEALRDVTDTAASAGVNTERAREQFVQTWESFSNILGGPAAVTVAQGAAGAVAGMGREYQGITFGGTDAASLHRQAAVSGYQDANALLAASMTDPGALAEAQDRVVGQDSQRMLTPAGMRALQEWLPTAPRGDDGRLTEAAVNDMAQRLLAPREQGGIDGVIDVNAVVGLMATAGWQGVTIRNAVPFLIRTIAGESSISSGVQAQEERFQTSVDSRSDRDAALGRNLPGAGAPGADRKGSGRQMQEGPLREQIFERGVRKDAGWWDVFGVADRGEDVQVAEAFLSDYDRTGRKGGISQQLAESPTARAGIDRVKVKTDDGPRIVTLAEAMRDYRDQLDRGEAQVVDGSKKGLSIAEAMNATGDSSVEAASARADAQAGMTEEEWEAQRQKEGGSGGKVVLGFTDEARRIFTPVYDEGFVTYEEGWEPGPAHVPASQRSTGSS